MLSFAGSDLKTKTAGSKTKNTGRGVHPKGKPALSKTKTTGSKIKIKKVKNKTTK
jgi:hypothetical protein